MNEKRFIDQLPIVILYGLAAAICMVFSDELIQKIFHDLFGMANTHIIKVIVRSVILWSMVLLMNRPTTKNKIG